MIITENTDKLLMIKRNVSILIESCESFIELRHNCEMSAYSLPDS